jgi:hypothetical protein
MRKRATESRAEALRGHVARKVIPMEDEGVLKSSLSFVTLTETLHLEWSRLTPAMRADEVRDDDDDDDDDVYTKLDAGGVRLYTKLDAQP